MRVMARKVARGEAALNGQLHILKVTGAWRGAILRTKHIG